MQRHHLAAICRVLLSVLAVTLAVRLLPANAQEVPTDTLSPGTIATVSADGDCLRLRVEPGVASGHVECIPDGASVTILDGAQELDGYFWRQVERAGLVGWVADAYLLPQGEQPGVGASCTGGSSATAGFTGLYAGGGISIAMWGGGNTAGMVTHSAAAGCALQSAWATGADGGLVGFLSGAPEFVNERWFSLFPNGDVPAGQVLIVRCSPVSGNIAQQGLTNSAPASTASAPVLQTGAQPVPEISAAAAIVVDGDTGTVLYEHRGFEALPPASLTKILTAIMVIEGADLDAVVQVDVEGREMEDSSLMGLRAGDCFTVRDLLYGLMLPSGNDAAVAIARYMAGSELAFAEQMNARARQLGLASSSFTDPHGLGSEWHVMSPYDVVTLSRYAMSLPMFREVVNTSSYVASGSRTLTLYNINTFLSTFPEADGVKTGYTEEAGRTLSASAVRDGRRVFVVLFNAPERDDDAAALLEWAFANHIW